MIIDLGKCHLDWDMIGLLYSNLKTTMAADNTHVQTSQQQTDTLT